MFFRWWTRENCGFDGFPSSESPVPRGPQFQVSAASSGVDPITVTQDFGAICNHALSMFFMISRSTWVFSTRFCCIGPMPVKNLSEVRMVVKIASGFRGMILTSPHMCVFFTLSSITRNSIQFVVRPGMNGRPCALKGSHVDGRNLKHYLEGVGLSGFQILLIQWLFLILRHHRLAQLWNCPAGSIGRQKNLGHGSCDLTQQGWRACFKHLRMPNFARGDVFFNLFFGLRVLWSPVLLVLPILIFPKNIGRSKKNMKNSKKDHNEIEETKFAN